MDLRQIARFGCLGEDALQPAWPGRPLVSGRERGESREAKTRWHFGPQPIRQTNPSHFAGGAPNAVRETSEKTERELSAAESVCQPGSAWKMGYGMLFREDFVKGLIDPGTSSSSFDQGRRGLRPYPHISGEESCESRSDSATKPWVASSELPWVHRAR